MIDIRIKKTQSMNIKYTNILKMGFPFVSFSTNLISDFSGLLI